MKTNERRRSGLVPRPGTGRPLTEAQETFRALLAKVEALRDSIDAEEEALDVTLSFYVAEIVPRMEKQTSLRKELVRTLAPYVNKSFFTNRRELVEFKELTMELLDEISKAEKGLTELDLREIYNAVHGVGYVHHERKTLETVKATLAKMFAEAGVDADFSEL